MAKRNEELLTRPDAIALLLTAVPYAAKSMVDQALTSSEVREELPLEMLNREHAERKTTAMILAALVRLGVEPFELELATMMNVTGLTKWHIEGNERRARRNG